MPYAPGVQDISGQLRAAGIAQAGQAWSQAIGNIGKDVADAFQTYKQNQYMTNQALGKFAAASQADQSLLRFLESGGQQEDPNAPKIPISPEVLKAYANMKSGKSDVYDAAVLGSLADSWQKNKAEQLQRQHIDLQNKLLGAQIGQIGAADEAYKAALARQAAKAGPQGQVQAPAEGQTQQTAPAVPAQGYGIPAVALGRFAQAGAATPTPPPTGIGQFAPTEGLRARSGMSEAAPWSENNPIGVINAQDIEDQMVIANRGKPVSADKIANEVDRRVKMKQAALERADVKLGTQEVPSDNGRVLNVIDTRTQQVIGSRPNPNHPDVAKQIEFNKTVASESGKSIVGRLDKIRNDAIAAAEDSPRVDQILDFLSEGVKTGPLTPLQNQLLSAAANAGLLTEQQVASVSKQEQLQTLLAKEAFAMAQKASGQGSISNNERKELSMQVANATKLGQTNYPLMLMVKGMQEKAHAAEELRSQLEDQGKDEREIDALMTKWVIDPRNSYRNFIPKERLQSGPGMTPAAATGGTPAAAGAKPQFRWDPATQKLIPL